MKTIYLFLAILVIASSCEKGFKLRTSVSGKVVDYKTGEPIVNAKVILKDGFNGSGLFTESDLTSDAEDLAYTDENGKFSVEIRGNYSAFLYPSKASEYWPYDLGVTAITNSANGHKKGSDTNDEVISLKAKAFIDGVFKDSKDSNDSLIVFVLAKDLIPNSWDSYTSSNGELFMPHGNFLVIGNDYYRYLLKFKRDGEWNEIIDSIYLEKNEVFRDTIFY